MKGEVVTDNLTTTQTPSRALEALTDLLAALLGGPATRFEPETELFGSLPELDSLALVELITAMEKRFGFDMDEDDITADVFSTVESLAAHIDASI